MRRFNPERELRKIQHGGRNKVIIGVVALLIILGISSSYALYQVRYSKRIIYTKVAPFSNKDINIAVYIDNKNVTNFPKKEDGKVYDKIECDDNKDNHVKAYFDSDTWNLEVDTNDKAKCNVYFKTPEKYQDTSGANAPELYQGLIPVKYGENGEVIVADTTKEWYNYDKHEWANAVLVDHKPLGFVMDLSGNDYNGKIVGGAQITDEGLVLDGNDDGIYLGDMIKDIFKHDNTVQIKLKRTETGRSNIMGNYNQSNFIDYEASGTTHVLYWRQAANNNGGEFINNKFVTVTYVFDKKAGKISIYNDDSFVTSYTSSLYTTDMIDYTSVYIGRDNVQIGAGSVALQGTIEKVMIYDDVLSESEIKQNLTAADGKVGSGGIVKDNLHLYYDFKVEQWNNNVDITPGTVLNMEDIGQMYVWIPRYKYQLFNAISGNVNSEQMINIKFEHGIESTGDISCSINEKGEETCSNAINGNWYTHPAFTFGDTSLPGIWVGKFETSGVSTNLTIKPNLNSIISTNISTGFNMIRDIDNKYLNNYGLVSKQIDTHVQINMEWGAMTYLTQSKYGRCDESGTCTELTPNNTQGPPTTGHDNTGHSWETENGQKASTTGNLYGIYDTSGGAWEYVMGILADNNGNIYYTSSSSGFNAENMPDKRYYNIYSNTQTSNLGGHLGDATRETITNSGAPWYGDWKAWMSPGAPWLARNGRAYDGPNTMGQFAIWANAGVPDGITTFRVVLTAQDGDS